VHASLKRTAKKIPHGKSQKTHGKENTARQIRKNARQRNAHGKEKEKRTAKKNARQRNFFAVRVG
jgi:hypothetical protein